MPAPEKALTWKDSIQICRAGREEEREARKHHIMDNRDTLIIHGRSSAQPLLAVTWDELLNLSELQFS